MFYFLSKELRPQSTVISYVHTDGIQLPTSVKTHTQCPTVSEVNVIVIMHKFLLFQTLLLYNNIESIKVQTLSAICQCCEHMHYSIRILVSEVNEHANSLQLAEVNEE